MKIFDALMDGLAFIAGLMIFLFTLFISYAVFVRYLGFRPPVWVLQFTEYELLWITFLGAAWLLREKGHIKIDSLVSHLSPKSQGRIEVFNDFLGFIVSVVLFWIGLWNTIDLYQRGILDVRGVTLPKYPLFCVIPFGGLLLALQFARNIVSYLMAKNKNKEE